MQILKKLFFLYKSNASLLIYFFFIKTKFLNFFFRKEKKSFKKKHRTFLKKKKIKQDYFSSNAFYFYTILKNFNKFKYLEIGSFEGNSAMFISRYFQNSKISCIDNWTGTEEYKGFSFKSIEKNFNENIKHFMNIKKKKITSNSFFLKNKEFFDVIYIDGYHKASQVFIDAKNSWKFLNKGGIIIFDDYIWKFFKKIKDNPCYAINKFLSSIKSQYKILLVTNSQLFIKKI